MEQPYSQKPFGTEGTGVQRAFLYPKPVGKEIGVPIGRSKQLNVQRSVASGRATWEAGQQMAWERRGSKSYYYRSVRENGRVRKVYVGTGLVARQAAAVDQERVLADRRRREKTDILRDAILAIDVVASRGHEEFIKRANRFLEAAGYHYHRGSWRMRRV